MSPKEVDNPSVSAIREAREEAGVIGNEKRERRQKIMSGGGREGKGDLYFWFDAKLNILDS